MKYQESITKLEEILQQLDDSELGVDELAEKVEEASKLLKSCQSILLDTEKKVNKTLAEIEDNA
jgi:exodeoxyribonuclease VII small subunit